MPRRHRVEERLDHPPGRAERLGVRGAAAAGCRIARRAALFVHPAAAGSGLKVFEDGPERHFTLISVQPFETGVVYLVYAPNPNPPTGSYEEAKEHIVE